jgi:hypothetical protein
MITGLLTVGAAPSDAAPSCLSGYLCVWEYTNYGGARGSFGGTNPDWSIFPKSTGGTWNNVASSAYNNGTSGDWACMWDGTNYSGTAACLAQYAGYSNLANTSSGNFDNKASSNNWVI